MRNNDDVRQKRIDYASTLLLASISSMAAILEQCDQIASSIEKDASLDRAIKQLERVGKILTAVGEPLAKRVKDKLRTDEEQVD